MFCVRVDLGSPVSPDYFDRYDPEDVYVQQGPSTGAMVAASMISFGVTA
jgi:hypothetical protein